MMTYGSNQHRYGRSPRQELLDDMREELLKAKKVNAQLALNNRLLNTKLQRLTREMKSSSNNNNVTKVERAEISTPSTAQSRGKYSPYRGGGSRQRPKTAQVTVAPTAEANSNAGTSTSGETTLSDQIRVLQEKNKKKLRVAKAYAEQNRKLKERLKQMREEFYELRRNRIKNESGATSPSSHLNGLESWDTTQLVELITKLEATRLETAVNHGTSEVGGSSEDFDSGSDLKEEFNGSNAETTLGRATHSKGVTGSKLSNDDQLPFDVLLYVIKELATAHCERQAVSMRLKES
ncbi:hypothetical protein Aduo_018369 [Ancylostoma duodenale]